MSMSALQSVIQQMVGSTRYLSMLLDTFSTPESAPISTPHTCDLGGPLTVVQNDGQFSVSGGNLVIPGQTTPAAGDLGFYGPGFAREPGLFVYGKLRKNEDDTNYPYIAFGGSASIPSVAAANAAIGFINTASVIISDDVTVTRFKYVPNTDYEFLIVLDAVGSKTYIRGGLYPGPEWTLIYKIKSKASSATVYPAMLTYDGTGFMDALLVGRLTGSQFATDTAIATDYIASPSSGATINHSQYNGQVEFTWTPGAGETVDLQIRRQDDNNCWLIRCDQAGSRIYLYQKQTGVEIEHGATGGVAQTWTVGIPYRVLAYMQGQSIIIYVNSALKVLYSIAAFLLTQTGSKITGFATAINYTAWPYRVSIPIRQPSLDQFATIGDSKTDYINDWHGLLAGALTGYFESAQRGWSGADTHDMATSTISGIDIMLPMMYGSPSIIFYNMGANDVPAMPAEADWKTDTGYILDALHAKWPAAKIYCSYVWRRTYGAECNTLAGWLDAVVSARSWAYIGDDERVWLEGGDDGATMTSDGIHYSAAGQAEKAAQLKAAAGL